MTSKIRAQAKAQRAVKAGLLARGPCEVCGDKKTDAHHDDYSKPLKVRWLCRKHHSRHHVASGLRADSDLNPIDALLLEHNKTREWLADAADTTPATVCRIALGKQWPGRALMVRLNKAIGVTADQLAGIKKKAS